MGFRPLGKASKDAAFGIYKASESYALIVGTTTEKALIFFCRYPICPHIGKGVSKLFLILSWIIGSVYLCLVYIT